MTATTTPQSALPQYQGRPVPWITRWTNEIIDDPLQVSVSRQGLHLEYKGGGGNRDSRGILWKREGIMRGGEPQYSEVNTYRQRASMNKRKCQVCGSKIDERPIRWLMGKNQLHMGHTSQPWGIGEGQALTMSAPTCSPCIPLALELCPHLKSRGYAILKVLEYEPWGVYGEAVVLDRETGQGRDLRGVMVSYENPEIEHTATVAFQQMVKLTKFVVEKEA